MSKEFDAAHIAARLDPGYYSHEKLTMLKKVFDTVSKEAGLAGAYSRDNLARAILDASKTYEDEDALLAFARRLAPKHAP